MSQNPPLTDAIAWAVADLIGSERPPAHDQLDRLFARVGLSEADPRRDNPVAGKTKRARAVLTFAIDASPTAGAQLVGLLIEAVRAGGGFRSQSPHHVGTELMANAQAAFRTEGFVLEDDGTLHPDLLEGVDEEAWGPALAAYIKRARHGSTDAALVTGTGKDLIEATARHVLMAGTGTYDERMGFDGTLFHAFQQQGLATPSGEALRELKRLLDPNVRIAFQQVLYLLGVSVNALRNAEGVGHGRPFPPSVGAEEAAAAVEAMALLAELLLHPPG